MAQSGPDRRLFLGYLASGILAGCGSSSTVTTPLVTSTTPPSLCAVATHGRGVQACTVSGPALNIDLTQTDVPSGTPVYIYVVGLVGSTFYYLNANFVPVNMATLSGASLDPIAAFTFPGSSSLPSSVASAIGQSYPLAWSDFSIPVAVGSVANFPLGSINTTNIPGLGTGTQAFSGRVYFSVGVPKIPFTVQPGGYTAPTYGLGSGATGQYVLYDWIEFSYDSLGNFNGNTTQVNQFGFPLALTGTPSGGAYATQGLLNTSRATILSAFAGTSAPFGGANIVLPAPQGASGSGSGFAYPAGVTNVRAISPQSASANATQGSYTAFNSYSSTDLTTAYTAWQSTPLVTTDPTTGTYTGVVFPLLNTSGQTAIAAPPGYTTQAYAVGSLVFYQGTYTMAQLIAALQATSPPALAFFMTGVPNATAYPKVPFSTGYMITSNDLIQCQNSVVAGNFGPNAGTPAYKNVGKMIAAAFNRGLAVNGGVVATALNDSTLTGTPYSSGTTFNRWAQSWHAYNSNGLAYGFAYDDVASQNPSIPPPGKMLVPGSITITLGKISS